MAKALACAPLLLLCLLWPAFILGNPFVSPDTPAYFKAGDLALRLFADGGLLHSPEHAGPSLAGAGAHLVPAEAVGIRSGYYGLFVRLLGEWTLWGVALAQAVVALYAVYRFHAAFVSRDLRAFAASTALLAGVSSLPWFAAYVMPDVLTGIAILLLATLLFEDDRQPRWRVVLDGLILIFCLLSHTSNLMLALGLVPLAMVASVLFRRRAPGPSVTRRGAGLIAAILVSAALTSFANYVSFGRFALSERAPPFLVAKSVVDGPGRLYLESACKGGGADYFLCRYVGRLPADVIDFLWSPGGIYMSATPEERARIRREQMPIVLNAAMAYPALQLRSSLETVWRNLTEFDLTGVRVDLVWQAAGSQYNAVPVTPPPAIKAAQSGSNVLIYASTLAALAALLGLALRYGRAAFPAPAQLLVVALIGNAVITGVLSTSSSRYQSRLIWVLPLGALAGAVGARRRHLEAGASYGRAAPAEPPPAELQRW